MCPVATDCSRTGWTNRLHHRKDRRLDGQGRTLRGAEVIDASRRSDVTERPLHAALCLGCDEIPASLSLGHSPSTIQQGRGRLRHTVAPQRLKDSFSSHRAVNHLYNDPTRDAASDGLATHEHNDARAA